MPVRCLQLPRVKQIRNTSSVSYSVFSHTECPFSCWVRHRISFWVLFDGLGNWLCLLLSYIFIQIYGLWVDCIIPIEPRTLGLSSIENLCIHPVRKAMDLNFSVDTVIILKHQVSGERCEIVPQIEAFSAKPSDLVWSPELTWWKGEPNCTSVCECVRRTHTSMHVNKWYVLAIRVKDKTLGIFFWCFPIYFL